MTLLYPWWLLGLLCVACVSLWSLFRPGRRMLVVGSLRLWREALDTMSASARRSTRRVTPSWLFLLAGATAAALATGRPVYYHAAPARRVAVALYPSAEIAADPGPAELRQAVTALLGRLAPADQVQLLRPELLGGASDWLSVAEAGAALTAVQPLPVPAEKLSLPARHPDAQHLYRFAPAGLDRPDGPRTSRIELTNRLAAVTIDALAAEPLADGNAQLFVVLRNQTGQRRTGPLEIALYDGARSSPRRTSAELISIAPKQRREFIRTVPGAAAIAVRVADDDAAALGTAGFLVRSAVAPRAVAMVGPDEPLIRRFVRIDPGLQLVGDPAEADLVIARGVEPPADRPALAIDPPSPPAGWRRANEPLKAILLVDADVAADDPVMRHVDLSGVAVRRVSPWIAGGMPAQKRLVSYRGDALIGRNDPAARAEAGKRRIFVAFDLAAENTNFGTTDAFVIFLANATRWLAPPAAERASYAFVTPLQAGRPAGWTPAGGWSARHDAGPAPLLRPGLYRDPAGRLHALTIVGLHAGQPKAPAARAVAAVPLPTPERRREALEFWPVLAVAAAALWLAGWALRLR